MNARSALFPFLATFAFAACPMPLSAQRPRPSVPTTWRLVEEWRVGGEVEGAYSLLDVRGLELLPGGGIAVLEYKDQQVHLLDARGRHVRTVGRQGAGPAEFQNANGLVALPNGNLVINDPDNNRFTILNQRGDFVRSIPVSHTRSFSGFWDAWAEPDGRVGEYVYLRRGGQTTRPRQIWSTDFARSDTLDAAACPPPAQPPMQDWSYSVRSARGGMSMRIPFVGPTRVMLHMPDGGTWSSLWPGFATVTHTPVGACTPDVTITLSGEPVPIPSAIRDSAAQMVTQAMSGYGPPGPDLDRIPRMYPGNDGLLMDRTGLLWVARHVGPGRRQFEIYSASGSRLATVDMPLALDVLRPTIITADRLFGLENDDDGLPHLVSYRILK
jgi:hypothetical protein